MHRAELSEISFRTNIGSKNGPDTPPSFRYQPEYGLCFIDLPALRREKELGSIASCEARAYVISLINQHYRTVEVSCGKESTWLGGYAYTREGRQTIEDAADLVSSSSLETVQNRTGKQVTAKAYYDDLPDGKHTVVVYEVVG